MNLLNNLWNGIKKRRSAAVSEPIQNPDMADLKEPGPELSPSELVLDPLAAANLNPENPEILSEVSITQVVQITDGSKETVDPRHFQIHSTDRNQSLDIIVNNPTINGAIKSISGGK